MYRFTVSHNDRKKIKIKITSSRMFPSDMWWGVTFLWCSIWDPQHFALFLLHDGHDLSANVGDAASLDDACNTQSVGRNIHMGIEQRIYFCETEKVLDYVLFYWLTDSTRHRTGWFENMDQNESEISSFFFPLSCQNLVPPLPRMQLHCCLFTQIAAEVASHSEIHTL